MENWNRFTHAIVVIGKNRTALKNYRSHPEHLKIAKEIDKMEEHGIWGRP